LRGKEWIRYQVQLFPTELLLQNSYCSRSS
jgi:hypothetical protein